MNAVHLFILAGNCVIFCNDEHVQCVGTTAFIFLIEYLQPTYFKILFSFWFVTLCVGLYKVSKIHKLQAFKAGTNRTFPVPWKVPLSSVGSVFPYSKGEQGRYNFIREPSFFPIYF